jgi:pimeloyl-ACP methyl ester carboxylesterase
MSTYLLVHGAWHGSWCWKRVRRALQSQGHEVFTPTLTGLGERSHLLAEDVNLETHIADVVNLIQWEELTDVILCGHSYAGAVVRGAADRIPDRISALVYLDAFILEDGESLHSVLPPELREVPPELLTSAEPWKIPAIPAELFGVNPQDRAWVDRQCTLHPLATFQQPLSLTGAHESIQNTTYIHADGYEPALPFPKFYEDAKAKGWKTLTIHCGHDVMLDQPEQLTQMLLSIAAPAVSA